MPCGKESAARSTTPHSGRGPAVVALGLLLLTAASCARPFRNPFASNGPPAPELLTQGATLEAVIAAVNQNAAKLQSYQTNDASISVPGMPGIPLMRGNIAAMRPGRIRLQASTALTGPEVDLGANDELFWSWVRRSEPPALYFVRHSQFAGSAAQSLIPIEPKWLLDAIGFMQFNPADQHQGPTPIDKTRVEIRSLVQSPSGPLSKRTVVDARRAWVLEQYVYDAGGRLVASAIARSHRFYPQVGSSLPQVIDIRVPAAELSLTIDVGTVQINGLVDNPQLWTMPAIPGVSQVDLGSSATPGIAPPLGEQLSRARWSDPTATAGPVPIDTALTPTPLNAPAPSMPLQTATQHLAPPATVPAQVATLPTASAPAPLPQSLPAGGVSAPDPWVR